MGGYWHDRGSSATLSVGDTGPHVAYWAGMTVMRLVLVVMLVAVFMIAGRALLGLRGAYRSRRRPR